MNWLGRLRAFDSELSFDSCTLVGSASSKLRLSWIYTSEEDQWPIRGDSAKSSHLTRMQNGKRNGRKTSPCSPTQSSQVPHHCGSPALGALLWEHFCRSIAMGATAAGILLLEPSCGSLAVRASLQEQRCGSWAARISTSILTSTDGRQPGIVCHLRQLAGALSKVYIPGGLG